MSASPDIAVSAGFFQKDLYLTFPAANFRYDAATCWKALEE